MTAKNENVSHVRYTLPASTGCPGARDQLSGSPGPLLGSSLDEPPPNVRTLMDAKYTLCFKSKFPRARVVTAMVRWSRDMTPLRCTTLWNAPGGRGMVTSAGYEGHAWHAGHGVRGLDFPWHSRSASAVWRNITFWSNICCVMYFRYGLFCCMPS